MNNLLSEFKKALDLDYRPTRYKWYHIPPKNQKIFTISYFLGAKRKTIKIKIRDFEIKKYRIWLNNANENIIINDIISFRKEK